MDTAIIHVDYLPRSKKAQRPYHRYKQARVVVYENGEELQSAAFGTGDLARDLASIEFGIGQLSPTIQVLCSSDVDSFPMRSWRYGWRQNYYVGQPEHEWCEWLDRIPNREAQHDRMSMLWNATHRSIAPWRVHVSRGRP